MVIRNILATPQSCCGCNACVSICNKNAISLQIDNQGFWYPKINSSICVDCGVCKLVCPVNNEYQAKLPLRDVAAFSKDTEVRRQSSSGGIFSVLAIEIIHRGGVVFGAAFDADLSVHHICIDNERDLYKLRGSKYLQSRVEDSFIKCKEYLDKGLAVIFSGTPCQIRGLKNFLRKEYEKLLTVDLICHGVPSPLVWKHYIDVKQKEFSTKVYNASFRDKGQGWNAFRLNLYSNECELQAKDHDADPYMRLFLSNVILRPSCYSCHFREGKSGSDITLADFWGIEKVFPEMNDDKGFSLVLINTSRGSDVFETVKPEIEFLTVSHKDAIKYNSSWYSSVPLNPNRNKFFRLFKFWRNYERRVEKLLKPRKSLRNALRRKFRCIIQKAKNFNYRY